MIASLCHTNHPQVGEPLNDSKTLDFDFITDEQFRASLASDYREMKASEDAQCWKAVLVLSGSIVEALLTEYLVVSGIRPNGKSPLEIDLSKAIEACEAEGVIRKETSALCTVIKGYRNLIHPGRVIRLGEEINPEGAAIASKLVSLITHEVAQRRKLTYGPTAEQIVRKIRSDQHFHVLLPDLLSDANELERTKLVDSAICDSYTQEQSFMPDEDVLQRLRAGYRQALESLPEPVRRRVAEKYVASVRNDSTEKIEALGDPFFLASDIALLSRKDAAVVVKHLLTRTRGS